MLTCRSILPIAFGLVLSMVCRPVLAQTFSITGGSGSGCQGILYDSGGQGASGYQNGEDYTFTLCPDIPGNVVYLTFFNFNLNTSGPGGTDYLTIYDGDNTGEITLGTYSGTSLQNIIVSGTVFNTTGCLTLVFHSNAVGTGVWAAGFQCTTPCEHPTSVAVMSEAAPALVCVGEPVGFNGSASFPVPGFTIDRYIWDFDDGTMDSTSGPLVSHAFPSDGEYVVQLTIIDDNDCESLNLVDLHVRVSTTPDFSETGPSVEVCFGETVSLFGQGDPVLWTALPDANFGDGIFLPDQVGQPFTSELLFEQFDPGQLVTSTTNIPSICVDMEHTFMGDLVLQVICPNGQTTLFHQQGGGGTYIGAPNDFDTDLNPIFGECWHYCWSPTATNGTWIENTGNTTPAGTPANGSLDPGTYESVQPFSNLIGCPLNGTWTFQSSDLWGADNGFICGWEINFDPSIIPDLTQFTPSWGPEADSSSWSGGTVPDHLSANGDTLSFTATAPGIYPFLYSVTDNFGCTYDTTITVTVDEPFQVDAGPDVVICNAAVQLSASVSGAPTACIWTLEMNDSWGDGWNGSQMTVNVNGTPTAYTFTTGTQSIVDLPLNTGDELTFTYSPGGYENEVDFILYDDVGTVVFSDGPFPQTGVIWSGTASCGGVPGMDWSWSPITGLSDPAIADPTVNVTSPATYTVTAHLIGHPMCVASDEVAVVFDPAADPGLDSLLVICPTEPLFQMIDMLGGTPTSGGVWTDASGAVTPGTFDPSTDPGGTFTYTVTSALGCVGTAQLEVQVLSTDHPLCCGTVDPGTDGSLTVCSTEATQDLFAQIGGTPYSGGTWTDPSGAAHTGTFIPGTDSAGDHVYTVGGNGSCPALTATVTVIVHTPPDAGTDGSLTACTIDGAFDLFAQLGGGPDPAGTWTDPMGNAHAASFDPGSDAPGIYTYTVAGIAPCPSAQAVVDILLSSPPNAGTNGSVTECSTAGTLDLFSNLGGTPDPAGTWTDPLGAAHPSSFDPTIDAAGPYIHTVVGSAPCPNAQAVVDVTIVTPPDAGTDGAATFCEASPSIDLLLQLGGTPDAGGAWTFNGTPHGSSFDPDLDLPGVYTYSADGVFPCPAATAHVVVDLAPLPDPGTNGTLLLCISSASEDLFDALGGTPEATGTWTDANNAAHSSLFDPATDTPGSFTYTVTGIAPCPSASATVSVDVLTNPDAGTNGAMTLCANSAPIDLFDQLGGTPDAGGVWAGPDGIIDGQFDPGTMSAGPYVYTLDVPPPCISASSTVEVVLVALPDAGLDASLTICIPAATIDLYDQLHGAPDAGGSWTGPSGAMHPGQFDPAIDPAGAYVYTVAGTVPCPSASASVTLTMQAPPSAGADGTMNLCTTSAAVDLHQQLSGADPGGIWTDPQGQATTSLFQPGSSAAGAYTYTVAGTAPCPSDAATVMMLVAGPPDAGEDGTLALCINGTTVPLIQALGGMPDPGGSWAGPNGTVSSGSFDPAADPGGTYAYTVEALAPCVNDIAHVIVTIAQLPDPGLDGTLTLCPEDAPANLFAALNGTPDTGGTWTSPDGAVNAGMVDPMTDVGGSYIYTVEATAPCPEQQAPVLVTISTPMNVEVAHVDVICHGACDGRAVLLVEGGIPGYTFTWPSGILATDSMGSGFCAGSFTVPISDAGGCSRTAQFTIGEPPPLEIDGVQAVDETCVGSCDGNLTVQDPEGVLFSRDLGLSWQSSPVIIDLCAGSYTLMMQDEDGCTAVGVAAVQSPSPVIAEFSTSPGPFSVEEPVVQFQNQSISATQFVWDFAGSGTSTELHPAATFPDVLGGEYLVCLEAANAVGCTDEVCHPIVIHDLLSVHAPNAFTPNADGLNEGFVPVFNIPSAAKDYELLIFDRWGERIFESHTVDEAWSGHFGGTMAKEDVYVWKLTARDAVTNKLIERTGTITLLK
ncbi:MAG TPA: PKD domain-containing protein [Flavobacteriales bacterium]|nr:PKD domain-containing protein [Flavobacteriales bacterium]